MTRGSFLRLQGKGEDEGNVRLRKMGGRKKDEVDYSSHMDSA